MGIWSRSIVGAALGALATAAWAQPAVREIPLDWRPSPAMRAAAMAEPRHQAPVGDGMGLPAAAPGRGLGMAAMGHAGSSHEIAFVPAPPGSAAPFEIIVSGQNWDALARVTPDGRVRHVAMPTGSRPHGLGLDAGGLLWVTLEYQGRVLAFAPDGSKVRDVDVTLGCDGCPQRINTHPHGLGVAADGRTIWVTGKATGTVTRIGAEGPPLTFQLPTIGSLPIYIRPGPDPKAPPGAAGRETMWATELTGNAIAAISFEPGAPAAGGAPARPPRADMIEYPIPTPNSRPIAVERGPDGRMWFSEEAGSKIGRIERDGSVSEFAVPLPPGRPNLILAALAFDAAGNLWVQQYVDPARKLPAGPDRLVRISRRILAAAPGTLRPADFAFHDVPTANTVMHRIAMGPDGAMWFTELNADRLGRIEGK